MLKIGSHVSMNGKEMLLGSIKEALSYEANAFMIYTGAPQNTRRRPISELNIEEAKHMMAQHAIDGSNIIVHAPYVMNLANPEEKNRSFAIDFLVSEIERTAAIGAKQIVLHPGAHVGQGPDQGIQHIINGLNEVLERTKNIDVLIALETMAGKGTEIGRSFDELAAIIDGVHRQERLSVCFDTCHTHDAGYDVKNNFNKVLENFDQHIGLDRISVFHINDSKNSQGAAKDRHENLGLGHIGFETLCNIVHHERFKDIPKILETPYVTATEEDTARVYPPYKEEIAMLRAQQYDPTFIEVIRNKA